MSIVKRRAFSDVSSATQLLRGLVLGMLITGLCCSLYKNLNELHVCMKDKQARVVESQYPKRKMEKICLGQTGKSEGKFCSFTPLQVAEIMACPWCLRLLEWK